MNNNIMTICFHWMYLYKKNCVCLGVRDVLNKYEQAEQGEQNRQNKRIPVTEMSDGVLHVR